MPFDQVEARRGKFRYRFDGLTARIDDGTDVVAIPLEWAFGSGEQAVTFVSKAGAQHHVEHYLTYYRALKTFGPTPGHRQLQPGNLAEAAGLLYKDSDPVNGIDGCFNCHSTGKRTENGVRCEACHGPGSAHADSAGMTKISVPRAGQNAFCGNCHRPPASDPAKIDWNYAWNVRHQPVYLSQSKCNVTCTTCHNPHQKLASNYDGTCRKCHTRTTSACGTSNCTSCHMPRVSPEPPLRFTNHWIGVYSGGSNLKPRPRR